jgi:hypothetical protein
MEAAVADRIEGKVAQILNRRELVLNVGEEHGVSQGMKFAVLNSKGAVIADPDTKATIGSVEVPKVLVEAVRVQPKLTVARTYRVARRNVGGSMKLLPGMELFQPPKWIEEPETLRTEDKPYEEEIGDSESYVKIGDPAVQVVGEDFVT